MTTSKKGEQIDRLKEMDCLPRKLSSLDFKGIAKQMADNAWHGEKSLVTFYDLNGNPMLRFKGHMYEPGYEEFSSTCTIIGFTETKPFILFDKDDYSIEAYRHAVRTTGSMEEVEIYIKRNDTYVTTHL